jgi:hypothetical protein
MGGRADGSAARAGPGLPTSSRIGTEPRRADGKNFTPMETIGPGLHLTRGGAVLVPSRRLATPTPRRRATGQDHGVLGSGPEPSQPRMFAALDDEEDPDDDTHEQARLPTGAR